jgi:hypothetical protein
MQNRISHSQRHTKPSRALLKLIQVNTGNNLIRIEFLVKQKMN